MEILLLHTRSALHFSETRLVDIPTLRTISVDRMPPVPEGREITRVDVIVRVRRRLGAPGE
jgi:hypothetical protein